MSRTLTISDEVYARLEQQMQQRGYADADRLLDALLPPLDTPERREELYRRMDERRGRLYSELGEMPDSTGLIREDRER